MNFEWEYASFALWDNNFNPPAKANIPQGKGMGMLNCHVVQRLRVKWSIFEKPRVGTTLSQYSVKIELDICLAT